MMFIKSSVIAIFFTMILSVPAFAAKVSCQFMTETQIGIDGTWIKSDIDFMKLFDMFGDGLVIPIENSLLAKLDANQPFLAGKTKRGTVYLMGSDMGVEGKLTSVENNIITIYDGFCTVSFG